MHKLSAFFFGIHCQSRRRVHFRGELLIHSVAPGDWWPTRPGRRQRQSPQTDDPPAGVHCGGSSIWKENTAVGGRRSGDLTNGFWPNTPLRFLPGKQTHRRRLSGDTAMMKYLRRRRFEVQLAAFQVVRGAAANAFSTLSHNSTANWHQLLALVF